MTKKVSKTKTKAKVDKTTKTQTTVKFKSKRPRPSRAKAKFVEKAPIKMPADHLEKINTALLNLDGLGTTNTDVRDLTIMTVVFGLGAIIALGFAVINEPTIVNMTFTALLSISAVITAYLADKAEAEGN